MKLTKVAEFFLELQNIWKNRDKSFRYEINYRHISETLKILIRISSLPKKNVMQPVFQIWDTLVMKLLVTKNNQNFIETWTLFNGIIMTIEEET